MEEVKPKNETNEKNETQIEENDIKEDPKNSSNTTQPDKENNTSKLNDTEPESKEPADANATIADNKTKPVDNTTEPVEKNETQVNETKPAPVNETK